jgi:hypothetical protein
MKKAVSVIFFLLFTCSLVSQTKTIHVFVPLCDNEFQGIVPVPKKLGNGKDAKNNLYFGAMYGVKSFLRYKTKDWIYIKSMTPKDNNIIERVLFKHKTKDVYLLADAYDGEQIKTCVKDFLKASNHQNSISVKHKSKTLYFGGKSDLLAYTGHDGLMDFNVSIAYNAVKKKKDIIILACFSKSYFKDYIKKAKANPLLWTNGLMAPEAYTLKAAIDGWLLNESGAKIKERAAQSYNTYQKCGIKGARNLFASGF